MSEYFYILIHEGGKKYKAKVDIGKLPEELKKIYEPFLFSVVALDDNMKPVDLASRDDE
jgi:hypothetical protein